jgi:hypothetical protein
MPKQQAESALLVMSKELAKFLGILNDSKVVDDAGSVYSISDTLAQCRATKGLLNWGYKSGKVTLQLDTTSVVCPLPVQSLSCSLEIEVGGYLQAGKTAIPTLDGFEWGITHMAMNMEFTGMTDPTAEAWSQYWHLDTHVDKPDANKPNEAHPMFHLHFGGQRMADRRQAKVNCWGQMLELRGPRFAHPPMDLVLVLDFILANTSGPRWKNEFCKNKDYNSAVCNAQHRFWKPYGLTLAEFYNSGRLNEENHPARKLWPTLRARNLH